MIPALDRTRALLDTPPPTPVPGQLDLEEHTVTDLLNHPNPEAAAFFADARAALTSPATVTLPLAPIPDLADLSGMPDGPLPDPANVDSNSYTSLRRELEAYDRDKAQAFARQAAHIQATGLGVQSWHRSVQAAVLGALAAAEQAAPPAERAWYAARLDAYSAAYGMKGWYRHVDFRGKHAVQCNRVRTAADGDDGRYAVMRSGDGWLVRDMDVPTSVGDVFETPSRVTAFRWVTEAESAPASRKPPTP